LLECSYKCHCARRRHDERKGAARVKKRKGEEKVGQIWPKGIGT
jgi:hypothetical protein